MYLTLFGNVSYRLLAAPPERTASTRRNLDASP
jgi:hypothetical protein